MRLKAPSSSDSGDPYLGFPLEQPEQGDDEAFDKETVPNTQSSFAMDEIGTVITDSHATSNQKLVGSIRSCAVEAHATAKTTVENSSNPRWPHYAPPAGHKPGRRWIYEGIRSTIHHHQQLPEKHARALDMPWRRRPQPDNQGPPPLPPRMIFPLAPP